MHARFRTPWISILIWGVLVLALAAYGNFIWNAVISAGARLITYGIACVALLRLRRLRPQADAFRLPAGRGLAPAGLALCAVLVWQMSATHAVVISLIATIGTLNWLLVRRDRLAPPPA